jgi:DNA-binding protein H-NS
MQLESLKEIRAQIRELERRAALVEQTSKPGISQLQAVIEKYRLTPEDVQTALSLTNVRRKRGVPKGTRLRPKYKNPNNPRETWAGRGLKPAWLLALLRQGAKISDLAV